MRKSKIGVFVRWITKSRGWRFFGLLTLFGALWLGGCAKKTGSVDPLWEVGDPSSQSTTTSQHAATNARSNACGAQQAGNESVCIRQYFAPCLHAHGVRIITIGQQIMLVAPADQLFLPGSPNIAPNAYIFLHQLVSYLQQYPKTNLRIASYVRSNAAMHATALAVARSRSLLDYLQRHRAQANFIYTRGYVTRHGASRIEMSFRSNQAAKTWSKGMNY